MNTASYVDKQIEILKTSGIPLSDALWEAAKMCVGWPYIFGDRGEYCTPSHRRAAYSSKGTDHPTIKTKCKNFEGTGSCSGCQYYPGGQTRAFDCRGFTYKLLLMIYGWKLSGAGATSQWNTASNWSEKGTIDSIPEGKLVCLFYTDKNNSKVMAHTGFGYKGQTIECSNGVQFFEKRNKKWTHWAIPACVDSSYIAPVESSKPVDDKHPTLKKGSKGSYVTALQTMLINKGYKLPKYGADGSFGNETLTAVKQFQKDHGLNADGIVGEKTWIALESSSDQKKLYTVTIPNLSKEMAEDLLKKYVGTITLE